MSCEECIKKDVCKIKEKYIQTKEMLEETLLNNENEDVLKAVKMDISCNHYTFEPMNTRDIEQHIPSIF